MVAPPPDRRRCSNCLMVAPPPDRRRCCRRRCGRAARADPSTTILRLRARALSAQPLLLFPFLTSLTPPLRLPSFQIIMSGMQGTKRATEYDPSFVGNGRTSARTFRSLCSTTDALGQSPLALFGSTSARGGRRTGTGPDYQCFCPRRRSSINARGEATPPSVDDSVTARCPSLVRNLLPSSPRFTLSPPV